MRNLPSDQLRALRFFPYVADAWRVDTEGKPMDFTALPGWMRDIAYDRLTHWIHVYTRLGWRLALGSHPLGEGCSCGRSHCPAPGAHPVTPESSGRAELISWARRRPQANLLLATGAAVCAFEISTARAGPVLTRLPPGPVVRAGRSYIVFARGDHPAPRAKAAWRTEGDHVLVPPSVLPTGHTASWVRDPLLPIPDGALVAASIFG
ncbi:MAG: bifunctional DNA primase/polymerase [Streptosporangiaceae bacterium]